MNPMPVSVPAAVDQYPRRVHTKIVGTTFEGRQDLLAECKLQGVTELRLVPDPHNRFDCNAIAIEANITDRNDSTQTVRLGYLSNSDRVCSDCGQLVGAGLFDRSRTLRCGECDHVFGYSDPVVGRRNSGETFVSCPKCGDTVDMELAKLVICPGCGGSDFGRGGLATRFSRALAAGVQYRVRVMEYTGRENGKSLGCNIAIQRVED